MTEHELKVQQDLQEKGEAEFVARTDAMAPFIRAGKDVCVVVPLPRHHLRRGVVILYNRKDGHMTLGRVTKVHHRVGSVRVCGDNRYHSVHGITRANIVGVLGGLRRNGGDSYISVNSLRFRLYSLLMGLRTAIILGYLNDVQKPLVKLFNKFLEPFKKGYEYEGSGHHHHHHEHHEFHNHGAHHVQNMAGGYESEGAHHHEHHHHHHHGSDRLRRRRNPFKITSGAWADLLHWLDIITPKEHKHSHLGQQAPEVVSKHSWKSLLTFWKKSEKRHHHHHVHVHTSYDDLLKKEHGLLRVRHGKYFFMGLRLPWVPKFLLDKYGLKKQKSVNNNIVTMMDWSIHKGEFQMPYNMQMQTLSAIVFMILFAKIAMAIGWLVYFLIYGNEASSHIYMKNLLHTATWIPIALFYIAYYYHLNKIFYMSIQKVTLMAAVVSLVRVLMFIVTLFETPGSRPSINLVTVFNLMEIICWVCISGFFFIMHYKLSSRHDFIPHFWLSKEQNRKRLQRESAKKLAKAKEREKLIREEYDHEQHYHIEH